MNRRKLSWEAGIIWDTLSAKEKQVIRKEYPIREDRNQLIRKVRARKVFISHLIEITGLSKAQLIRILHSKKNHDNDLADCLRELQSVVQRFYEIVTEQNRKGEVK